MSVSAKSIEETAINTVRTLSMDAVQAANSGHPGTPMALAPAAYTLYQRSLNYCPEQPLWPGRDRFVLSCGHASMLLYSMIHLAGIKGVDKTGKVLGTPSVTLEDIKNFRQLDSPCAGHPEFGDAAGIETTTGPLGQGVGNSVGMAVAGKWFAARYNKPDYELFGFDTYAFCSDGDIMEGVACEAASLAGHLQLDNLCWLYDDNQITIEGRTELAFSEDVGTRFEGLGWNVVHVDDANDVDAIEAAFEEFKRTDDKPTLIVLKSIIGYGAPNKADTSGAHGSPLGPEEIKLTKEAYGWPDKDFYVPDDVPAHFAEGIGKRGQAAYADWDAKWTEYQDKFAAEAAELKLIWADELPADWDSEIPEFPTDAKGTATRNSGGKVLNAIAAKIPWMVGGSADLAPSTKTLLTFDGAGTNSSADPGGRNMHFGIREHAMAAAANGMSLSGLRAYGATFFVFSDYCRPSMRLSGIMHQPVLYVYTHDSIGLGEDGTTHQPIEHLAACRAIPRLAVVRPGDANEVAECYRRAVQSKDHPTAFVLSRQNVPTLDREKFQSAAGCAKGGYILADAAGGEPDVILMGTGSELSLCVEAFEKLTADGVKTRVVSMPCFEWFDAQDQAYRDSVLPPNVSARVAIEAGIRMCWDKYLGPAGKFIGMTDFGLSGPFDELYEKYGITSDSAVAAAKELV